MNGVGAILVGLIASTVVWFAWNYLSRCRPFSKVDDALGVVYTHGFAGLTGGLLVGLLADPAMTEYGVKGKHYKGAGCVLACAAGSTATRSTSSGSSSSPRPGSSA